MTFPKKVENFQPYYVFNKKKLSELQIGHVVLKEMLEQEQAKEDAAAIAKQRDKAVADAAVAKVLPQCPSNFSRLTSGFLLGEASLPGRP